MVSMKRVGVQQNVQVGICAIEDSDQPAHPRSLISVFERRSMDSRETNVYSGGGMRLGLDYADEQTCLNLCCAHMLTCAICWIPAQINFKRRSTAVRLEVFRNALGTLCIPDKIVKERVFL